MTDETLMRAQSGSAESQYLVGKHYLKGKDYYQGRDRGLKLLVTAARQGHLEAAYQLGAAYRSGLGTEADPVAALKWFRVAAEGGHAGAQYQLGIAYMEGRGVKRDRAWGARWLGKSAQQGDANGQFALGNAYAAGQGLPQDRVTACMWLELARRSGHPGANEALRRQRSLMKPRQVARAVEMSDHWRESNSSSEFLDQATLRYLQFRLKQRGYYPGQVTGLQGPGTEQAVRQYLERGTGDLETLVRQAIERIRKGGSRKAGGSDRREAGLLS